MEELDAQYSLSGCNLSVNGGSLMNTVKTAFVPHRPTKRVLDILETLANSKQGMTLSELSRATKIAKGSLSPIVHTLAERDFLQLDPRSHTYSIGLKAYLISHSFYQHDATIKLLRTQMHAVEEGCLETCQVGIRENDRVLYIAKVDSPQPIRLISDVGRRLPLQCTAIGKSLLLDCTKEELQAIFKHGMKALTEDSISDIDILYAQLRSCRERRITSEHGEALASVRCVATPIRVDHIIQYALGVSVPAYRFDDEKKQTVIKLLDQARTKLEAALNT